MTHTPYLQEQQWPGDNWFRNFRKILKNLRKNFKNLRKMFKNLRKFFFKFKKNDERKNDEEKYHWYG